MGGRGPVCAVGLHHLAEKAVAHLPARFLQAQALLGGVAVQPNAFDHQGNFPLVAEGPDEFLVPQALPPPQIVVYMASQQRKAPAKSQIMGQRHRIRPAGQAHQNQPRSLQHGVGGQRLIH